MAFAIGTIVIFICANMTALEILCAVVVLILATLTLTLHYFHEQKQKQLKQQLHQAQAQFDTALREATRTAWLLENELQIERRHHSVLKERYTLNATRELFAAREQERLAISQEIHDGFASLLWTLKLNIQHIGRQSLPDSEIQRTTYECDTILDETLDLVRTFAKDLYPRTLEHSGLSAGIAALCGRIKTSSFFDIEFSCRGIEQPIPKETSLMIYRVAQELLTNCIKHSGATDVTLELTWNSGIGLALIDNGKPFRYDFSNQARNTGLGMYNLRSRLSMLHASIEAMEGPPNRIQIFVPTFNHYEKQETKCMSSR